MLTVNRRLAGGAGLSQVLLKRAARVALDWDTRQKSRFEATDSQGRSLGVFLPRGSVLRGGDVLVAEDGSLIQVIAQPQPVLRITPNSEHGTPFDLIRAAYHLGNRHIPLELTADHLQLEPDHVLAALLKQMHLDVNAILSAFEPESGAYTGGTGEHGHSGHDHGHGPAGSHDAGPPGDHVHRPGCEHDH